MISKSSTKKEIRNDLPLVGKSRWSQLRNFLPISKEKFRLLGIEGKAPQPERLGVRCTFFDNTEVHKWLADPAGYRAPDQRKGA